MFVNIPQWNVDKKRKSVIFLRKLWVHQGDNSSHEKESEATGLLTQCTASGTRGKTFEKNILSGLGMDPASRAFMWKQRAVRE